VTPSGTGVVLYDDAMGRAFEPFSLTRPVSELRVGTTVIADRWSAAFGSVSGFVAGKHLADFDEPGRPHALRGEIPAGTILVNNRCVPALALPMLGASADGDRWMCEGRVAAVMLKAAVPLERIQRGELKLEDVNAGPREVALTGRWLDHVWDPIAQLTAQLTDDIPALAGLLSTYVPDRTTVIGDHPVWIEEGASIAPFVCFDSTGGPILVRKDATVFPFTRIGGPCFIDQHVTVAGDSVANCSIGEWSKVHGEMSSTIVHSFSNKGHYGFVGHSYLGKWVNLGAGTTTSNLKNTYGPVALWTPTGNRDTGQQFLGTMFGDHVKTGIGMRLNTGTVLGAGANIWDAMPPKAVSPFSWGSRVPYDIFQIDKFLEVAERMMARRKVALTDGARRQLAAAHSARWTADR
jgi:UDP-N-acetylglucosamine diphosphorylase/glucosamine-1-phosphate N-acetyltransferase